MLTQYGFCVSLFNLDSSQKRLRFRLSWHTMMLMAMATSLMRNSSEDSGKFQLLSFEMERDLILFGPLLNLKFNANTCQSRSGMSDLNFVRLEMN